MANFGDGVARETGGLPGLDRLRTQKELGRLPS
jgi:hypothetical protein